MDKGKKKKWEFSWKDFLILLFFVFWIISSYQYSILEEEYNSILLEDPFNPKVPSLNFGWERTLEEILTIDPNEAYTYYGTNYGYVRQVKYYLYSNIPLYVYWTKSEADCKLAYNGEEFSHYPELTPNSDVYEYLSQELSVVSDSSLCVINTNSALEAKVKIVVDQK